MKALGASLLEGGRGEFRVWAPLHDSIALKLDGRTIPLQKNGGYHETIAGDVREGSRYTFVVNGQERPDPASRSQPDGVHAASEVIGSDFEWHDRHWRGIALEDHVIYELHVGTFTDGGTFESAIERLDELKELGITAIELLPIGQFPGNRNWGYDGVYVGAAQSSYGGPRGLKKLVDACHARGLAILLDVVYNHLGPEGNYLNGYAPYFTDRYKTPWGSALNFDGPHSDDVRWYFIHNALQWIDEFHIDGLRVDAVHAIVDRTAEPFLQDLTVAVHQRASQLGRKVWTFAESNLNDPRVITPKERLGLGFDSQWTDDYHHALHVLFTGEQSGYYEGYGRVSDLARVMREGYFWTGQHNPFRRRRFGVKPNTRDGAKFVVCAQNHDQIGNRMYGERLSQLVSFEQLRLSAALIVLSPFLPMLFMGEEYGETAPFQYFTSHSDRDLIEAVRRGRRDEFKEFKWAGEAPDPHDEETFRRSRLNWSLKSAEQHAALWNLYRDLLRLRRETPALRSLDLDAMETIPDDEKRTLIVRRGDIELFFNFAPPWNFEIRPPSSSRA
ncbi:MAG TPA: malto-oligosyltrehalose trehalohydrolase [Thermoanaerobaculia bacterium]